MTEESVFLFDVICNNLEADLSAADIVRDEVGDSSSFIMVPDYKKRREAMTELKKIQDTVNTALYKEKAEQAIKRGLANAEELDGNLVPGGCFTVAVAGLAALAATGYGLYNIAEYVLRQA